MSAAQGSAPLLRSAYDLAVVNLVFLLYIYEGICMYSCVYDNQSRIGSYRELVKQKINFCSRKLSC